MDVPCQEFAVCLWYRTIADWGGLESILHSKVLPGITETVSWTSGMSSASSFSAPRFSSCRQSFSLLLSITVWTMSTVRMDPKIQKDLDSKLNKILPIHRLLIHHMVQLMLHSYFTLNSQELEKRYTKEEKVSITKLQVKTSHAGFLTFFNFLSPFFSNFLWASYTWGSTLHRHSVHFP